MPADRPGLRRTWPRRFHDAGRGVLRGARGEVNFRVHFLLAAMVIAVAWFVHVSLLEWCLLAMCVAGVLSAELFNTAIERLARATHPDEHPLIRDCLDISSGAVLTAACGAAIVGLLILAPKLWDLVGA